MAIAHPSSQNIKVAVDAAIFTVEDGVCKTLLIQMRKAPFEGRWAFPGGLIEDGETCLAAARRILGSATGVKDCYLEQLATFDAPDRDPLGRVVSVAHFALMPSAGVALRTTEKYADVRWWPVAKLPPLAYDHRAVAEVALGRIRAKLEYTNVVWSLLPKEFTLAELQAVDEAILGRRLDKRNFRKKVLASKLLVSTGKHRAGGAHRPAELFAFKARKLAHIELL
jgi:8-oxo-dGTP diphosphatase